ncbi:MAG TPA: AI-2E family transporter [Acidimicrobiales bacterium]|nr:AI-2E family transporter [Acidimicrobiales bacterium]
MVERAAEPPPQRQITVDVEPRSFAVVVGAALVAMAAFAVFSAASDMFTGIGVGLLVGVALSPIVSAVQRGWGTSRGIAAALVGLALTAVVVVIVLLVAPATVRQSQDFSDELPSTVRDMYSWPIVGDRLERADAAEEVERWIEDLPANVDDKTLADAGERLLGGIFSALVVLVTALGVLVDGEIVVRRLRVLVPRPRQDKADRLGRIVYATFGSYFAGSLFVAGLAGLVTLSAGLLIGVPLAPVAALWTTLTNLIPQIGGLLGGSFFVLLALTAGPVQAVTAAAVFVIYQNLENHVLQPAIVGRAVNLSPPATMLAALVGGAAAGVPGALMATPLIGAAKAVYLDSRGETPPPGEAVRMRARLERVLRRWRRTPPAAEAERQKEADAEAGAPVAAAEAEAGDTAEVRSDAAGDVAGDVGAAGEPEATAAPATAATDEAGERP